MWKSLLPSCVYNNIKRKKPLRQGGRFDKPSSISSLCIMCPFSQLEKSTKRKLKQKITLDMKNEELKMWTYKKDIPAYEWPDQKREGRQKTTKQPTRITHHVIIFKLVAQVKEATKKRIFSPPPFYPQTT